MSIKNRIKITSYRKFQIISFVIFSVIVIFYLKKTERSKKEIWENARFTIAITCGISQGLKSSFPAVHYYFYANGIKYSMSFDISLKEHPILTNGGRYLVVYSSKNNRLTEFQYDCPIPDSINDAPYEGWKKPPFNCKLHDE